MDVPLDPPVSDFETEAQAASYDRWFRAKVAEGMSRDQPRIPHDEAVARVEVPLAEKRAARAVIPALQASLASRHRSRIFGS